MQAPARANRDQQDSNNRCIANDDTENQKVDAFAAGADDYIAKLFFTAEIISRSTAHLRAAQREWELIGSNRELRFLGRPRSRLVAHARAGTISAASSRSNLRRHRRGNVCGVYQSERRRANAPASLIVKAAPRIGLLRQVDRLQEWLAASSSSAAPTSYH